MPKLSTKDKSRYDKQRPKHPAPVVTTVFLRKAKGLTLQDVCDFIRAEHGIKSDRGTISAIELGHRGASAQMLAAYADALGIQSADIDTAYEPRQRREQVPA